MSFVRPTLSWYAWIGFTGIILIRTKMMNHEASKIQVDGGYTDQLNSPSTPDFSDDRDAVQFPWEPRAHKETNEGQHDSGPFDSSDHQDQSNFISMMTFANQNLRPPPCRCCR